MSNKCPLCGEPLDVICVATIPELEGGPNRLVEPQDEQVREALQVLSKRATSHMIVCPWRDHDETEAPY